MITLSNGATREYNEAAEEVRRMYAYDSPNFADPEPERKSRGWLVEVGMAMVSVWRGSDAPVLSRSIGPQNQTDQAQNDKKVARMCYSTGGYPHVNRHDEHPTTGPLSPARPTADASRRERPPHRSAAP